MTSAIVKPSKEVKTSTSTVRSHLDAVERARQIYLDQIKRAEAAYFDRIKRATEIITSEDPAIANQAATETASMPESSTQ